MELAVLHRAHLQCFRDPPRDTHTMLVTCTLSTHISLCPPNHPVAPGMSQAGSGSGGMWDKRSKAAKAKAGDPRTKTADLGLSPCPKTRDDSDGPGGEKQPTAKPCPPMPTDCRLYDGHPYVNMVPDYNPKERGANKLKVPESFGTTLKDCPLLRGTSQGVMPRGDDDGEPWPWPHENLFRGGFSEDEETKTVSGDDHDFYMLPDQATCAKITNFHNFCLELPDTVCNYCSITLYPEDVCWGGSRRPREISKATPQSRGLRHLRVFS